MSDLSELNNLLADEALIHYASGREQKRLSKGAGLLELVRSQELISRYLPPPPAVIFDVGGGAGVYSFWLAQQGYEVHLIDAVPLHIEQARHLSQAQPEYPLASLAVGDARQLNRADNSVDAVLLLGPLYHLTERTDRIIALREAHRILKTGGFVFAAGVSRFASTLDGLFRGHLDDPEFVEIVKQDLIDGQHRNPNNHPRYFTKTFFHHSEELRAEVKEAGLHSEKILAIEGPGWLLQNFEEHWNELGRRDRLLEAIRWLETEPSILGMSAHIMAVARK
ncbi:MULTISPECIES: class I SAM-dependent methyltransferase [unclassified Nostoc]|uniref:class I SAM-dependent methyltransferase n=1 Tax=unclassified Nostoc TaxID=2593658 RepID=UPI002AD58914|nr:MULTISPECIES: methyltransferase domain-containing protein [unclassified Nostoc]MDZ8123643.1 methyltransferase domain-containing protein [Nostoc sp. CmiVER01]MDZ8225639.1 methyltransferase domain-containing protein [Nostoc sp. ChiVER01]